MNVTLEQLKAGSVVIDSRGTIGVVTEIRANNPMYPVIFAVKASGTQYKAKPGDFKAVIGQVDLELFKGVQEASKVVKEKVSMFGLDVGAPGNLKGVKVGEAIMVSHYNKVVQAVFEGYSWNRPKYPVAYSINGKKWKGADSVVVGKAA